jgi:L-seryl-tRNA(Ser) seleniumtransferase
VLGRSDLIECLRTHPLTRALRPDKLTLAALAATLEHYVRGEAEREIPVWRMIAADLQQLSGRAERLAAELKGVVTEVSVREGRAAVGGGSLPGETLPTVLLALRTEDGGIDALAGRLRQCEPAVVGRIEDDLLLLDLRTVLPEEDVLLLGAVRSACGGRSA